jgi:hypothetical protein
VRGVVQHLARTGVKEMRALVTAGNDASAYSLKTTPFAESSTTTTSSSFAPGNDQSEIAGHSSSPRVPIVGSAVDG